MSRLSKLGRGVARRAVALAMVGVLAPGCGSSSHQAKGDGGTDAGPAPFAVTTTTIECTVTLPAGVSSAVESLVVSSSVGANNPDATGAFSLEIFSSGSQLAIATTPAGNPLLLGFIDATHTTLDVTSSAVALLYFALGMPLLPAPQQLQGLAFLRGWDGAAPVAAALTSQLAADPEAFGAAAPTVLAALETAVRVAGVSGAATPDGGVDASFADAGGPDSAGGIPTVDASASDAGGVDAGGVSTASSPLTIDVTKPLSGLSVIPDGPFAMHINNASRRRAYAYVDQISTTDSTGTVTMATKEALPGGFLVLPENGATNGVLGGLIDLVSAFWGTQAYYYTPKDSPESPVALPLAPGSAKTTYKLTVVGPGLHLGNGTGLSSDRLLELLKISIEGWYYDLIQPVLVNVLFGAGVNYGAVAANAVLKGVLNQLGSIYTDLLGILQSGTNLSWSDAVKGGIWSQATATLWNTIVTSNSLRTAFENLFDAVAAFAKSPSGVKGTLFTAFNSLCNRLGALVQIFDAAKLQRDVRNADLADQWIIEVDDSPVIITPKIKSVQVGDTTLLTTTIENVTDLSAFTFHWRNTGLAGDLLQSGAGSQSGNDFCATSPAVSYLAKTSGKTDTITVEAWKTTTPASGPVAVGCKAPAQSFGIGMAAITVGASCGQAVATAFAPLPGGRPLYFTTDDTQLYFVGQVLDSKNVPMSGIFKGPLAGGVITRITAEPVAGSAMATDGTNIYFAGNDGDRAISVNGGTSIRVALEVDGAPTYVGLASGGALKAGGTVFFNTGSGVATVKAGEVDASGYQIAHLYGRYSDGLAGPIVGTNTGLYYWNGGAHIGLERMPLDGIGPNVAGVTIADFSMMTWQAGDTLAADDTNVYFRGLEAVVAGQVRIQTVIRSVPVGGGTPTIVVKDPAGISTPSLATDGKQLYWGDYAGFIMRAPVTGGDPIPYVCTPSASHLGVAGDKLVWFIDNGAMSGFFSAPLAP